MGIHFFAATHIASKVLPQKEEAKHQSSSLMTSQHESRTVLLKKTNDLRKESY